MQVSRPLKIIDATCGDALQVKNHWYIDHSHICYLWQVQQKLLLVNSLQQK